MTTLLPGSDAFYEWMLGGPPPLAELTLAPGGVSPEPVITMLRDLMKPARAAHGGGDWFILEGSEVVGMCGAKAPADETGMVEIGYGVAPSRQGRGHASRGVGLMLQALAAISAVRSVTAETSVANIASQLVLEKNGFVRTGRRHDDEDGALICWRLL